MGRGSSAEEAKLISRNERHRQVRDIQKERVADEAANAQVLELHEDGLLPHEITSALNKQRGLATDPFARWWNDTGAWKEETVRLILRKVEAARGQGPLVQQGALQLIETLAADGRWPDEIAAALNNKGFKSIRGKTWSPGSVLTVLRANGWTLVYAAPSE
jgi:hypothetical protein